jgi:hypothetical protein
MSMHLERTREQYDDDVVTEVAESLLEVQAMRFHAVFGRFPERSEPVFFVAEESEPQPLPYPELLALVIGHVLAEPSLQLRQVDLARPFAVLVLLRLGLPAAAAEEALTGAGRFVLH